MEASSEKQFVVIAGPNGSGKSTTSKKLLEEMGLSITAFDWDARFESAWNRFGYDPLVMDGVRESVNREFDEYIESGFQSGTAIAYETNYHNPYNLELLRRAQNSGYSTYLYFLFLNSIDLAEERVKMRVSKGGHHVSKPSIIERYHGGLELLNQSVSDFQTVLVFDNSELFQSKAIMAKGKDDEDFTCLAPVPKVLFERVPKLADLGIDEDLVE